MTREVLPPSLSTRYTDLRYLASGGMGLLYKARDTESDRWVVLKIVRRDRRSDRKIQMRFRREAEALARIRHPNVVPIVAFHDAEGVEVIAMAYLEGRSLQRLLSGGPLPETRAVAIALQVAVGVAAVHEAGFVHRDVKPGNVVVRPDGTAVLVDFGLIRSLRDEDWTGLTSIDVVVGTVRYMAPETIAGRPATPAADMWQIGLLLYLMLTGLHPLEKVALDDVVDGVAHRRIRPPSASRPNIDPELERITMACLHLDPERRPSARALARLLGAWQARRAIAARCLALQGGATG